MFGDSVRRLFSKSKKLSESILPRTSWPYQPNGANEIIAQSVPEARAESNILASPGVRADLRFISWCSEGLVLSGWATVGGKKRQVPKNLEIFGKPLGGGAAEGPEAWYQLSSYAIESEHLDINNFVKSREDLTTATFTVLLPYEAWDYISSDDLQIVLKHGSANQLTPFTHRYRWGSAGHPSAQIIRPHRYTPRWDIDLGLCISRSQPTAFVAGSPEISDHLLLNVEVTHGFQPTEAHFQQDSCKANVPIELEPTPHGVSLIVAPTELPQREGVWGITLRDEEGRRRLVHWSDAKWDRLLIAPDVYLEQRSGGALRLVCGDPPLTVDRVDFSTNQISVRMPEDSAQGVDTLILRGPRAILHADKQSSGWFVFDLDFSSWGRSAPVPPTGGYRLFARRFDGSERPVRPSKSLSAYTPFVKRTSLATFRTEHAPDNQLYLNLGAPLRTDEKGLFNRRRLAAIHTGIHRRSPVDTSAGVFLESWYGKSFSDNPAPLIKALRNAGVSGPYYVAIADWSVAFPDDVHPVIVGSEAYWTALGSSRIVIFNTWLPSEFKKGTDQFVVQTWHGTPLKSLGMDVPHRVGSETAAKNLQSGSAMWDLLVSQSSYATEIFRRAYVYDGEIAEVGYPRNDALTEAEPLRLRQLVRSRIGLPQDAKVILYAPTWRQEDKGSVGPLNVPELLDRLPEHYFVAVRGHSVTLRRGSNLAGKRIADVTSYPEPAELMAMSDCLVTDYSSIMFDYAATGKPILYYTPDYGEYVDLGRGAYFDLQQSAPGPLNTTPNELAKAILASPCRDESDEYRAWQRKFVPYDDGHASERLAHMITERLTDL